jgi:hypothetical protein
LVAGEFGGCDWGDGGADVFGESGSGSFLKKRTKKLLRIGRFFWDALV